MITIYKYEQSLIPLWASDKPTIFLAGPTVRGHQPHLVSWRPDFIAEAEKQRFDGNLVLPEFAEKAESDKGKMWIPAWEFAGLNVSDIIAFWIPRTKELIGLTTNHEHGYWMAKNGNKVLYGRPENAYRNDYLDLMWAMDAEQDNCVVTPIQTTLADLVRVSIHFATANMHKNRIKSKVTVESPYGVFNMLRDCVS